MLGVIWSILFPILALTFVIIAFKSFIENIESSWNVEFMRKSKLGNYGPMSVSYHVCFYVPNQFYLVYILYLMPETITNHLSLLNLLHV